MSQKPFLEAVRILAAAAWADGEIAKAEADIIRQMIEVGPLDDDEQATATGWLHTRPGDDVGSVAGLAIGTRRDIYLSAVRVAAADGCTVRDERNFLTDLQRALDLDETTSKEVRDEVRAQADKGKAKYAKLYRLALYTLDHELTSLSTFRDKAMLLVNVASECGMTPQYEQLEALHKKYADRGFTVVGFPCNQFGGQEPGTTEEIHAFVTTTYGVTFPMMDKLEVKGDGRNDVYALLSDIPDASGEAGEVTWNFEKFVVSADGNTISRFRPQTKPDDPTVVAAIEAALPG